jgi:cytochrome c biogenesis protein CcdA
LPNSCYCTGIVWEFVVTLAASGIAQGIRHAVEPDHVAAVMAMTTKDARAGETMRYAALWGTGHALVLGGLSGGLFWFQRTIPDGVSRILELLVAAALIGLGLRALASLRREVRGLQPPIGEPQQLVASRFRRKIPVGMGMLHGLAGSGALAACMIARQPTVITGVVSIALYAAGTLIGMAALAGALRRPMAAGLRQAQSRRALTLLSGLASMGVGVVWGVQQLA